MDSSCQVDIAFIDLEKLWYCSPLTTLNKLFHYGIQGELMTGWGFGWPSEYNEWFLMDMSQILFKYNYAGVPRGTLLGPLMFLLYINDVKLNVISQLQLSADDCISYWIINSQHDHIQLQHDLNLIVK